MRIFGVVFFFIPIHIYVVRIYDCKSVYFTMYLLPLVRSCFIYILKQIIKKLEIVLVFKKS